MCQSSGMVKAIPHNSKCRYGERGAADAKPKAQIILDAAKVSAASGGSSEPKQGQRSQSARGFCPRSTMRVPQPDIIEHFGNADAVPQLPERCLSRKAGIVRCCLKTAPYRRRYHVYQTENDRWNSQPSGCRRETLPMHKTCRRAVILPLHNISSTTKMTKQTAEDRAFLIDKTSAA